MYSPFQKPLRSLAKQLKLFLIDCDGVLTDNHVSVSADAEAAGFSVRDEGAIFLMKQAGIIPLVVSGRDSAYAETFCKRNDVRCYTGVRDKKTFILELMVNEYFGTPIETVAYMGDGLADIEIMRSVGLSIAVADAIDAVKEVATLVTQAKGGQHAVWEAAQTILDARNSK